MKEKIIYIKNIIAPAINKTVKSIEQLGDDSFVMNDSYLIRLHDNINPFSSADDIQVMYAMFEDNKNIESLIYIDKENKYSVYKYTHRKNILDTEINERQITLLTKLIKTIHKKEAFDFLTHFNLFDRLAYYKQHTNNKLDGRHEGKIIRQIKKILMEEEMVICHNSITKNNTLFGYDDVSLIDLRDCGLNYYQFDLASIILSFSLSEEQIITLLKVYYGKKYSTLKLKKILIFVEFLRIFNHYKNSFKTQNEH